MDWRLRSHQARVAWKINDEFNLDGEDVIIKAEELNWTVLKKSFLWDEDDETNGGRVQPKSSLQSESKKQDIIHQNPHALLYIPGFSLKTQFCAIFWCEITDLKYAFRTFEKTRLKNLSVLKRVLYSLLPF